MITYETLKRALDTLLNGKGVDTSNLAIYILNFFGYYDSIIDNILRSDDRDIFYMLEEEGIVATEREEITLIRGKIWRIHYWVLKKDKIIALANMEHHHKEKSEEYIDYEKIYEEIDWEKRSMPDYSGT